MPRPIPAPAPAPTRALALAFALAATQPACFDRVAGPSTSTATATVPGRLDSPAPAMFAPPYGVDAGVWGRASALDRAAFVTIWQSSIFALDCGAGGPTTESWFSLMLLVRSQQEALLQHLSRHAPHAEAKAYGWIGLVKLDLVFPDNARAALAGLNEEVDTCGGCTIVFKSDRAEHLAAYFDAPLPDEPDRDWRPAGSPPVLDLPGVPLARPPTAPSTQPSTDSPPPDL